MSKDKEKTIFVKSALKQKEDETHPLAIFEQDERHPGGEAWVSGDQVVEVFPTKGIVAALRGERIVECSKEGTAKSKSSVDGANDEPTENDDLNAPTDNEKSSEAEKKATVDSKK